MPIVDQEQQQVRTPTSLGPTKVIYLHIQPEIDENGVPTGETERSIKLDFSVLDQNETEMKHLRPVITARLIAEYPQQAQQVNQFANWLWGVVENEVLP